MLLLADMMLYMLEQGLWVISFINTSTLHDFDRKRGSQQGKASGFTLRKHYCIHVTEDKQQCMGHISEATSTGEFVAVA